MGCVLTVQWYYFILTVQWMQWGYSYNSVANWRTDSTNPIQQLTNVCNWLLFAVLCSHVCALLSCLFSALMFVLCSHVCSLLSCLFSALTFVLCSHVCSLLSEDGCHVSEGEVVEVYQRLLWSSQCSPVTKQFAITSAMKLATRMPQANR